MRPGSAVVPCNVYSAEAVAIVSGTCCRFALTLRRRALEHRSSVNASGSACGACQQVSSRWFLFVYLLCLVAQMFSASGRVTEEHGIVLLVYEVYALTLATSLQPRLPSGTLIVA